MNRSPKAKELASLKQLLLLYGDHSPFLYADFVHVKGDYSQAQCPYVVIEQIRNDRINKIKKSLKETSGFFTL